VKKKKKKKRRRCHLIKGELLKTQFWTDLAKTRKKKKQKSQRRASVNKAYQSRIRNTAVAGGQINSNESFKATPCICIVQRRKSCEIMLDYLFKCFLQCILLTDP
jgi:hypothetical protein